MYEFEMKSLGDYVEFTSLFKLSDLERALVRYRGSDEYEAVLRYYFGCVAAQDAVSLLPPLGLLRHSLDSFPESAGRKRRDNSEETGTAVETKHELIDIQDKVEQFDARLSNSLALLKDLPVEVAKKLHFVWLGGGVGDIQRDYINIWKQVMATDGYELMLWYDSDALLAYETHRVILQAAKADGMISGGDKSQSAKALADFYEERVIALKQQHYNHIRQAVERGMSADEARIDLLVRAYGQEEAALRELRDKHLRGLAGLSEGGVVLRDLHARQIPWQLDDIYDREINLRGNFAAASDVVRVEVLFDEAGLYTDVDNLPPLLNQLGGVDISSLSGDARIGVLQLLLDHNPHWMPGRMGDKYTSYLKQIPIEVLPALERFAESRPALSTVFHVPEDRVVRQDGLRAAGVRDTLTNSFLMAHAGSKTLASVLERFRFNDEVVRETARLAVAKNLAYTDFQALGDLAIEVIEQKVGPLAALPNDQQFTLSLLAGAVAGYYRDGLRPDSENTIFLTGPAAVRAGMNDYAKENLTPDATERWLAQAAVLGSSTVNLQTEEELDHSWKENQTDVEQWLIDEKQRWQEGRFKARYSGSFPELLKRQTIEFDSGWPVIEGRHVLSSDVLQHLADRLGAPFLEAMSTGSDAHVTFDVLLPLGFDERQAIRHQDVSVRPPVSLGDAATRSLGVVDVLERMGQGSFDTGQLTPSQRLQLAGLLGLESLDNRSFEGVQSELDNLANNVRELGVSGRYAAIERQLFKHNAPAFMAGLNNPVQDPLAFSETALVLKKTALERPLSLRQWGQQVARIQNVARREYRDRIIERTGNVMNSFEGAVAKLVPQDLLLSGLGEAVGGRCYPLALVMAAAMSQAPAMEYTLRERFYMSVLEPESSDSKAFVQTLEALRGAQPGEIGSSLPRTNLEQLIELLETRAATSTLMLNSDNHSMLLAKLVTSERSTYHFYDPNFGVFEFEQAQQLHLAMKRFFLDHDMASHYAAYGESSRPEFDLIELDGAKISALTLSSEAQVSQVLMPGDLKGLPESPDGVRLASARGQSLVKNTRLGRSLMALDSQWWSRQIEQVTAELQQKHQLEAGFIPLFETLEQTQAGDYELSLIAPTTPEKLVRVSTDDPRLPGIRSYLSDLFGKFSARQSNLVDPVSAASVHTLNAGFAIQALMNALRAREGAEKNLTLAVRLHAYVNYAQIVHGVVFDVIGVVQLVRQGMAQERLMAQASSTVVGEALGHVASEGVGTVLGLANVGFDIYQLSHAENDVQIARFGTQLAFDSASLVLAGAGLGASAVGAVTASAVLGGAAVIVGGLAIGVAALAQGFALIAEDAKQVGLLFDELARAYREGGYRWDQSSAAWTPRGSVVFKAIDLRAARLEFDSPMLFPLRDHFGVPDYDVNYERAINIRDGLGLPRYYSFKPLVHHALVLPCTPKTYYGYDYMALPFSTTRHDTGFDLARRLETGRDGNRQFLFSFYSFPSEYIVRHFNPVYVPTVIQVRLDDYERLLVVPHLPKAWHGKLTYEIEAGNAACTLQLNPGVSLELIASDTRTMNWTLLAPWADESDIKMDRAGGLVIGTVNVNLRGRSSREVVIELAGSNVVRVDWVRQQLIVVEHNMAPGMDAQTLHGYFKALAQEHRLAMPYTPVHKFLVPYESPDEPRYVSAYYDVAEDRFLYIRADDTLPAEGAVLGVVLDGFAYFYHPQTFYVWKVDAMTGLLSHRYRLMIKGETSLISECSAMDGGGVRVVQRLKNIGRADDVLTYLITDDGLFLSSLTRDLDPALEAVFSAGPILADWRTVVGNYHDSLKPAVTKQSITVNWRFASLVTICWQIDDKTRDMAWVRSSDRLIIRPVPRRHHARGWPLSIKDMHELTLLTPAGQEGNVFVTYERSRQRLVRQQLSSEQGGALSGKSITLEGLSNVIAMQEGYAALTDKGLFFEITARGELQLAGLNDAWFKDKPKWWLQLPAVTAQYPVASLVLLGLHGVNGNRSLCAWYLSNRLLLADLGSGGLVRRLSVTPDNAAGWLFDVHRGEIYRQPFIENEQLTTAFGNGVQLLRADALPVPQLQWPDLRWAEVRPEGASLRATSVEGIEAVLHHREAALITGVNSQWVAARAATLSEQLRALVSRYPRCAPLLTVARADRFQWYVSASGRLIDAPRVGVPESSTLLGTQQQTNVLLYETSRGLLHTYPHPATTGPLDYVQREGNILTIDGGSQINDVLPMLADDVTTLVLRLAGEGKTCHLSRTAWLRLKTVIVDCRSSTWGVPASVPDTLIWALDTPDSLVVTLVGEHLVLLDPDTGHSLIFREINAADVIWRGEVYLTVEGERTYVASALLKACVAEKGAASLARLNERLRVTAEPPSGLTARLHH